MRPRHHRTRRRFRIRRNGAWRSEDAASRHAISDIQPHAPPPGWDRAHVRAHGPCVLVWPMVTALYIQVIGAGDAGLYRCPATLLALSAEVTVRKS